MTLAEMTRLPSWDVFMRFIDIWKRRTVITALPTIKDDKDTAALQAHLKDFAYIKNLPKRFRDVKVELEGTNDPATSIEI